MKSLFTILSFSITLIGFSQNQERINVWGNVKASEKDKANKKVVQVVQQTVEEGDTMPLIFLNDVVINERQFENAYQEAKYQVLKRKVLKVYPYVEMAKNILAQIDDNQKNLKKRKFKKYRKQAEEDLRADFEEELRNLTVTEGKILVKLINRETNNSCYRLIKELKGGFAAFFWQKVSKRYGYDLKEQYFVDQNQDLELIIASLEASKKDS